MDKIEKLLNEYCSAMPPLTEKYTSEGYVINENDLFRPKTPLENFWYIFFIALNFLIFLSFWWLLLLIGFIYPIFWWLLLPIGFIYLIFSSVFRYKVRDSLRDIRAVFFLLPGELVFNQYPLMLGENYTVTFTRKLKSNRKFTQDSLVSCKLLCIERVSNQSAVDEGTKLIQKTALIYERELESQSTMLGDSRIKYRFNLALPIHLPSSFEATNNQIRWVIVVKQTIPDIVNVNSNFTILVKP